MHQSPSLPFLLLGHRYPHCKALDFLHLRNQGHPEKGIEVNPEPATWKERNVQSMSELK